MKPIIFLLHATLFSFAVAAQTSNITWQKTIGCIGSEAGYSFIKNSEGNYLIAGQFSSTCYYTDSAFGFNDGWIIKVDTSGNKIWSKGFGGNKFDRFNTMLQTFDGGYVLVGDSQSDIDTSVINKGDRDFWIVKVDSGGNLQWQKNFGGSQGEMPSTVIETNNLDLLIAGYTSSNDGDVSNRIGGLNDGWVIRLNQEGNLIWEKTFGSTSQEGIYSICKTIDGNYLLGGYSSGSDNHVPGTKGFADIWVFKMDDTGAVLWSKTYGGTQTESAESILPLPNGSFVIGGATNSNDHDFPLTYGDYDLYLAEINDTGKLEWAKTYGGTGAEGTFGYTIASKEGGYLLSGNSISNDYDAAGRIGGYDVLVVKIDDTGKVVWNRMYGSSSGDVAIPNIYQLVDSSYVMAAIINASGGNVTNYYGGNDTWLFRISKDSSSATNIDEHNFTKNAIDVYPTITDNEINIIRKFGNEKVIIQLTDIYGKNLQIKEMPSNKTSVKFSLKEYAAGMYFVNVWYREGKVNYKVIKY